MAMMMATMAKLLLAVSAGGSGTTGLPRSAIRAGSADRARSAIRTGGTGFTLGADGTARSVLAGGSGSTGRPGRPLGAAGSGSSGSSGRPRGAAGAGGNRLRGGGQVKPGFQPAKFPRRMGLGGVHIVDLEGYPAGGAVDI